MNLDIAHFSRPFGVVAAHKRINAKHSPLKTERKRKGNGMNGKAATDRESDSEAKSECFGNRTMIIGL